MNLDLDSVNASTQEALDAFCLRDAGQRALSTALALWHNLVRDPPRRSLHDRQYDEDRRIIDALIRTPVGLNWPRCSDEVEAYRFDGDYEWCGAFAARCWRAAGLDPMLATIYFSSTYRLDMYGRERLAFASKREKALVARLGGKCEYLQLDDDSTPDDVAAFAPRAGDILLVGSESYEDRMPYGTHVTIVESFDAAASTFLTVEGNATGELGNRQHGQGVVKQARPLGMPANGTRHTYIARRLIRPPLSDLTQA